MRPATRRPPNEQALQAKRLCNRGDILGRADHSTTGLRC
jgi:hypothetical protein